MRISRIVIVVIAALCLINSPKALAACPSADLTGDCFVDFEDFAVIGAQWLNPYDWNDVITLANQWLTTDPCVPDDMVYIPDGRFEMGDHFSEDHDNELPLHDVLLDAFCMSKYHITNQKYCDFLNSALGQGLITVTSNVVYKSGSGTNYPYCDTYQSLTVSQINWNGSVFSVRTKGSRSMANDPMVQVSWYGSVAYCNWRSQQEGYQQLYDPWDPNSPCDFSKHGYRLATEAEWEYAARGGLSGKRFPWGDTITHSQANYYSSSSYSYDISPTRGYHPDYNDVMPYTSPVGSFTANGYGLYDMAGNVWDWCNDWYSSTYYSSSPPNNPTGPTSGTRRVHRGGCWSYFCRVADRGCIPHNKNCHIGFRVVLDLE